MKKILFWQTSDWYNYNLAYSLQEKNYELYSIIDTVKKPKKFFYNQKLVNYKKIWFYHDHIKNNYQYDEKYLSEFEKKYKISLWLLAYNERVFYNFNNFYNFSEKQVLSILEQECRLFENILDEINPDFLIISFTWQHQGELLRKICKSKGIKILMINPSSVGGSSPRYLISEEFGDIDYDDAINKENKSATFSELEKKIDDLGINKNVIKFKNDVLNHTKWDRISAGIKVLTSKNENAKTHYTYFGRTRSKLLKFEIASFLKTEWRERFINKNFPHEISDEDFIYFPLHTDEERGLLIAAPFYNNQIEIIKHIVKSLPIGYKLYLKEHVVGKLRGWRDISEYKQMMSLPNVRILHPEVKSSEIIKKCKLVISINSTTGFESLFYGKPSISFVKRHYSKLSSCLTVDKINELPNLINQGLKLQVDPTEVKNYIENLEKELFEFNYFQFITDYGEKFHLGGNLVDVEIKENEMKEFLSEHKEIFDKLVLEYEKKIVQHDKENKQNNSITENIKNSKV